MKIQWTTESTLLGRWIFGVTGVGMVMLSAWLFYSWTRFSIEIIERWGGYIPVMVAVLFLVLILLVGGATAIVVSLRGEALTPRFVTLALLFIAVPCVVSLNFRMHLNNDVESMNKQVSQAWNECRSHFSVSEASACGENPSSFLRK